MTRLARSPVLNPIEHISKKGHCMSTTGMPPQMFTSSVDNAFQIERCIGCGQWNLYSVLKQVARKRFMNF
ncbi:hypothetical protein TNCV_4624201 [Trichonephila clavipes]|nr:hypothetical protein TNCV_4624201 [Trichonephila clavipes]